MNLNILAFGQAMKQCPIFSMSLIEAFKYLNSVSNDSSQMWDFQGERISEVQIIEEAKLGLGCCYPNLNHFRIPLLILLHK